MSTKSPKSVDTFTVICKRAFTSSQTSTGNPGEPGKRYHRTKLLESFSQIVSEFEESDTEPKSGRRAESDLFVKPIMISSQSGESTLPGVELDVGLRFENDNSFACSIALITSGE